MPARMSDTNRSDTIIVALIACCMVSFSAVSAPAAAAEKKASKTARAKVSCCRGKAVPKKVEKLACRRGTEWKHARIALELLNGKVQEFAYYSIWKPRTCSVHVQRGDPYSQWDDVGNATTATLKEDKGAILIQNEGGGRYHFIFREVDRMRYCGAEGTINGSLIVSRGKPQCELEGVMDDDPTKSAEPARAIESAEAGESMKQPAGAN